MYFIIMIALIGLFISLNRDYKPVQDIKTDKVLKTVLDDINIREINMGFQETGNSHKKPYEDYRAITDTTSRAYKFLHQDNVQVNEQGFVMLDNEYYCVALGGYWGTIGDKFIITLETGVELKCVIGDMKSNKDTNSNNYAHKDGHVVEFIIDSDHSYMRKINIKYHGLLNTTHDNFYGKIVNIEKLEK